MTDPVTFLYGRPAAETGPPPALGLRVARYQLEATELPAHFHAEHLLLLHQGTQAVRSHRRTGHRVEEDLFRPGDGGLYPAGEYGAVGWDGPADVLHVHLDAQVLAERARHELNLPTFALHDRFRLEDGLLLQLGRQLLAATSANNRLGRLYTESLATALSYHLITHHATHGPAPIRPDSRLPMAVLARLDAYIEANAEQPITLAALASLANLSVFHFARRFKLTTGLAPYQYVLDWKIKRARQLLRAGEVPIAAIGDALGFASPAHFSAAFRRAVGQGPRAFQQG
jgi:AraC family transcriptional regulator